MKTIRLACLAALSLLAVACSGPIGSQLEQDATGVKAANPSPNTLSQTDSEGQWTVTSPLPVQQTTLNSQGELTALGSGTSREMFVPIEGVPLLLRSGTDIGVKVAKLKRGDLTAEGVEINTITSEPTRASNEALDRLKEMWAKLTEEQRAAWVKSMETIETVTPGFMQVIRTLLGGV